MTLLLLPRLQVGLPLPGYTNARYCVTYCGWHAYFAMGGKNYKFMFTANSGTMVCGNITGTFSRP